MSAKQTFRAGDTVLHLSGETWVLACDEDRGRVVAMGWPEGWVKTTEVIIVKSANDEERLKTLRQVAASIGARADLAKRQLASEVA